jgi:phosphopantothenoylcysteine decarboxylase/phosphopantothenate--cysteine ligase
VDGPLVEGKQKAPSFEDLAQQACHLVNAFRLKSAKKKKNSALVTLGATMSAVDDVRFLGNQSSGRTGLQIALALYRAGCEVELIAGLHQVQIPSYLQQYSAITHSEMSKTVERFKSNAPDLFVHSAAILDFEVKAPKKMKVTSDQAMYLELKPTSKILDRVKWPRTKVIAFKLESRLTASELQKEVRDWLRGKKIDFVVANRLEDVSAHSYRAQIFSGKAEKIAEVHSRRELADWFCASLVDS